MTLHVIGLGLGRTGTFSLKTVLEQLGFGPCHHMERIAKDRATQVPLWNKVLDKTTGFEQVYRGMASAVDWPTAAFSEELLQAYPNAKFILTHRDAQSWAESFGSTIYTLLAARKDTPPDVQAWLDMVVKIIEKSGFSMGLDAQGLAERFNAHNQRVKALIPKDQLLVYQVKEGWQPLCDFLDVPVPSTDFPRTNNREEFWELIKGAT
ncbi:sulfotransferase family protein [Rheinheimera sp. UJ63]|uniref:sulfotransferase family protein n=1 Tax=Rheinheimera sp. UJ63 TaxID=2910157 RepID=UPI001F34464D|nr:sulfotransferase family protein [Rheinheimera sp. UJ63]MCF4007890.1 hypothetical protein [Rheinheimera sp. UJ63]